MPLMQVYFWVLKKKTIFTEGTFAFSGIYRRGSIQNQRRKKQC
uniref:Uncharacterized protein n=1 Tax=Chlamydia pneumoniae TaxID=83558 RepID=A0A0F7XCI1_CHLPN|nr:hypothetical protein BN1224_U1271_C_06940 [Chlamydia pneumoniae]